MNKYLRTFLYRGAIFGGLGPIVVGIVYFILSYTIDDFFLTGGQVFLAILSTYLLAFIQAGSSVFEDIEEWPAAKSLLVHLLVIYIAYAGTYIVNSWIPFEPLVLIIFTLAVVCGYLAIWLIVYAITKNAEKKLNAKLNG